MYKFVLGLILLSFNCLSYAENNFEPDERRKPISIKVDVSQENLPQIAVNNAVIKSIIENNWKINTHTKNLFLIKYDDETVKIIISNNLITMTEVLGKYFDEEYEYSLSRISSIKKWLASLKFHILRNIDYQYHIQLASKFEKEK